MPRIGRYEILDELGRGFMGAVYKARDAQIGRAVAIKIILTAQLPPEEIAQYRERFRREAQAAGRMSHPGIVTIYDIAESEAGEPYIVMEYIEGSPLDRLFASGAERPPLGQALDWAQQVAEALDYAHSRGVVHRDVKPANILVTREGRTKIADFGIAKLAGTQLTQAGQLVGTPAFMSPEQFSGAAVDARTDLFSLGAVLYWMCTGEKPFAGDSVTTVSFKVVYTPPIPARNLNPTLPADLDNVLAKCLAKNPDDRYASCGKLGEDLERLQRGKPVAAPPAPGVSLGDTVAATPPRSERPVPIPSGSEPAGQSASRRARRSGSKPAASVSPAWAHRAAPAVASAAAWCAEKLVHAAARLGAWTWLAVSKLAVLLWKALRQLVLWLWIMLSWTAQQLGALLWWLALLLWSATKWIARSIVRLARRMPRKVAVPVAVVLFLLLVGGVVWLWLRLDSETSRGDAPPAAVTAAAPASRSERSERAEMSAAAMSRLLVVCDHNFRSARLQVFLGDQKILDNALRGHAEDYGPVHIIQGHLETSTTIPAGQHTLRVHVSSERDMYDEEGQISGAFAEAGSRIMQIEFGKGSALGVISRHLSLSWR